MLTQCPNCQTTFRVTREILRVADGQVRCGRCQTQFDALRRLLDENDGSDIQAGQYLRVPSRAGSSSDSSAAAVLPPATPDSLPKGSAFSIEVEEPASHERITLEGRHIEISGTYPMVDDTGRETMEVREETFEDWAEFDDPDAAPSPDSLPPGAKSDRFDLDGDGYGDTDAYSDSDLGTDDDEEQRRIQDEESPGDAETSEQELFDASASDDIEVEESVADEVDNDASHAAGDAAVYAPAWKSERAQADADVLDEEFLSPPAHRSGGSILWKLLALPLVLLLVVQIVHHARATLARHPRLGPPLTQAYEALGLTLRPEWDLHAYEVRQWGIISDPAAPGTLKVRATIKNLAGFAQPYPLLKLVLEDRWGEQVRSREFEPIEYLDSSRAPNRLLAPAQQANATIVIVDPGPDAEGFHFDICLRGTAAAVCAADLPGS